MKRISKNKIEFDCIIREINTPPITGSEDTDLIQVFIQYFDREDDISLVLKGKYNAKHLEYFQKAYSRMELVKITIEVSETDNAKEKYKITVNHLSDKEDNFKQEKEEDVDIQIQ